MSNEAKPQKSWLKYHPSGSKYSVMLSSMPRTGARNRTVRRTSPAPSTRLKSIRRSFRNGLDSLTPHASLTPFLMALKTAVAATSMRRMDARPVRALALTMSSTVSLTNSVDTGTTLAMSLASSIWSCCPHGPMTKPTADMVASISGKIEKRV